MATKKQPAKDDAAGWRKEAKNLRKHLVDVTNSNLHFFKALDKAMSEPTVNRKHVAAMANALEMVNDAARYFALGVDYQNDKKQPIK